MTASVAVIPPPLVEWAEPGDRTADYCLWDYPPLAPTAGKLRQSTLLFQALDVAGGDPRLAEVPRRLRAGLGPFRTVWGVKQSGGRLTTEYYFYDYERLDRDVSIDRVLGILAPLIRSPLEGAEARPYFMFSLEPSAAMVRGEATLDEIDVYVGNPGSSVSSGICYRQTVGGLELKNFYFFFDAREEREDIGAKVACSAHLDLPGLDLGAILWPELVDCGVIVVANKRAGEGVYFSRIQVEQLILFLERLHWPEAIVAGIAANRTRLDHLLFDVGFDYRMVDGRVIITKSAYYGIL